MKRTIIAAAAVLLAVGAANAQTKNFNGAYLGAEGGYSVGSVKLKADGDKIDLDSRGPSAGGYAGYGATVLGDFYVGVEGSVGKSWNEVDATVGGVDTKVKKGINYGASALLGYVLSADTLAYGRAGWERAKIKTDGVKDDLDGARFGLGVEKVLLEGFSARGELGYTLFEKVKGVDSSAQLDEFSAKAGVGYRF